MIFGENRNFIQKLIWYFYVRLNWIKSIFGFGSELLLWESYVCSLKKTEKTWFWKSKSVGHFVIVIIVFRQFKDLNLLIVCACIISFSLHFHWDICEKSLWIPVNALIRLHIKHFFGDFFTPNVQGLFACQCPHTGSNRQNVHRKFSWPPVRRRSHHQPKHNHSLISRMH